MTDRLDILPSTLAEAVAAGCDIVQPKLRGLWCRVVVSRGSARVYSTKDEELTYFDVPKDNVHAVFVGDYFGPPRHELSKIVVWDCWSIGDDDPEGARPVWTDLKTYSYRDRFAFMKVSHSQIGLPLHVIKNYPITNAHILWSDPNPDWCGLVFRSSKDPVRVPVRVCRRYDEAPRALE
jgi:hypothetical protein